MGNLSEKVLWIGYVRELPSVPVVRGNFDAGNPTATSCVGISLQRVCCVRRVTGSVKDLVVVWTGNCTVWVEVVDDVSINDFSASAGSGSLGQPCVFTLDRTTTSSLPVLGLDPVASGGLCCRGNAGGAGSRWPIVLFLKAISPICLRSALGRPVEEENRGRVQALFKIFQRQKLGGGNFLREPVHRPSEHHSISLVSSPALELTKIHSMSASGFIVY